MTERALAAVCIKASVPLQAFEGGDRCSSDGTALWCSAKQLVQKLLLVGRASEPHVAFETTRLMFPPTTIGRTTEETVRLDNRECIPLSFHFDM